MHYRSGIDTYGLSVYVLVGKIPFFFISKISC